MNSNVRSDDTDGSVTIPGDYQAVNKMLKISDDLKSHLLRKQRIDEVFSLAEGDVRVSLPKFLTPESQDELRYYLRILMEKLCRWSGRMGRADAQEFEAEVEP